MRHPRTKAESFSTTVTAGCTECAWRRSTERPIGPVARREGRNPTPTLIRQLAGDHARRQRHAVHIHIVEIFTIRPK